MPTTRTAGGPKGRGSYRITSNWRAFQKLVDDATAAAARQLQQDILRYLHENLHRWTGEMAERAFCEVYFTASGTLVVRFGSDAAHTFWHEVRYHPQIRETADIWLPKVGEYIKREAARRLAA